MIFSENKLKELESKYDSIIQEKKNNNQIDSHLFLTNNKINEKDSLDFLILNEKRNLFHSITFLSFSFIFILLGFYFSNILTIVFFFYSFFYSAAIFTSKKKEDTINQKRYEYYSNDFKKIYSYFKIIDQEEFFIFFLFSVILSSCLFFFFGLALKFFNIPFIFSQLFIITPYFLFVLYSRLKNIQRIKKTKRPLKEIKDENSIIFTKYNELKEKEDKDHLKFEAFVDYSLDYINTIDDLDILEMLTKSYKTDYRDKLLKKAKTKIREKYNEDNLNEIRIAEYRKKQKTEIRNS